VISKRYNRCAGNSTIIYRPNDISRSPSFIEVKKRFPIRFVFWRCVINPGGGRLGSQRHHSPTSLRHAHQQGARVVPGCSPAKASCCAVVRDCEVLRHCRCNCRTRPLHAPGMCSRCTGGIMEDSLLCRTRENMGTALLSSAQSSS
jgi:hypothetical protein